MKFSPHFSFNGNCREAFQFYADTFGGKIVMQMTYGESPAAAQTPQAMQGQIIHARIDIGGQYLMGADSPADRYEPSQGVMVTINTETPAEADRLFDALAMGGFTTAPMSETFFAHRFGMCTDKFGVQWMVIAEKTP